MIRKKNKNISFQANENDVYERLDNLIVRKIPGLSRSYIQKLINNKFVLINGFPVSKNYRIKTSDLIEIPDIDACKPADELVPLEKSLKIIYEDNYILAISKEPKMSVYPSAGNNMFTLANAIVFYLKKQAEIFEDSLRPGIVHRLDKDTSGIILIAKDKATQLKLSALFHDRKISKCYYALAWGNFNEEKGHIDLPVGRSKTDRKKMSVSPTAGRESVTDFKVIERFDKCTLLEVSPKTGRTHQIRVHLSYINHPVIGDALYGNRESDSLAKVIGLKRQFLHAKAISFNHPFTGEKIELKDRLPGDLNKSLGILRKNKI